jgi:cytochrome c551/c552
MPRAALAACLLLAAPALAAAKPAHAKAAASKDACVTCHERLTPTIVSDWRLSKHGQKGLSCDTCHGSDHTSRDDVAKVKLPTPDTCAQCHAEQVDQFKRSKHAFAWAAMKAMPTFHYQPMALMQGQKGCGACHALGLKTEADLREVKQARDGFGNASCDACHTRHSFRVEEARSPQACRTCHMGFDHPQWEMYESSKHGVRSELKQLGVIPKDAGAPTCQTCHMQQRDRTVATCNAFPDLLTFHDAPTVPEQKLFVMFLEHRMRTFQGAFHNSPDYALWYGWSEMVRDLSEIRAAAEELRAKKK